MDRAISRPPLLALAVLVVLAGLAAPWAHAQDVPSQMEAPTFSPFGDLPVNFGFAFPGGGNLTYNVSTPILMGLQQLPAALEGNAGNISENGGWVNVTLPEPLQVEFDITFRAVDREGREKVYRSDVKYVISGIKVAIEVVQEISDILSQCFGIRNTTVQVLDVFETATCTVAGGTVDSVGDCHQGAQPENQAAATPEGASWALSETFKEPEVMEQMIKEALKQAINNRYEFCSAKKPDTAKDFIPDEPPAPVDPFLAILVALCLLLVLGVLMGIFWCGCCMGCCCWHNADEGPAEKEFLDQCRSLAASRSMPLLVRITFYLLIAVNTLFFLSANISLGATINIDYIVEGELIRNPSFYDFSIAGTAIELIKVGIYLLGIILLGFSVVWPYVKLVILAAMFTLPPRWVRPVRRQSIMQWIDTLGKWSMFDVFALSGCMALFYIEVYSPATVLFPLGYYGIILSMTPVWGMFANLIAQIISQGLSIFGLWAHDQAYITDWHTFHGGKEGSEENKGLQLLPAKDGESQPSGKDVNGGADKGDVAPRKAALVTTPPMPPLAVMSQKTPGVEHQQQFTSCAKLLLLAMLVATMAMIVCGNFIIGFKLEVVGVLGLIQELAIPGSSVRSFTPISVAQGMARAIPPNEGAGIVIGTWALIVVMVACVLVVPLAQASALLALWVLPMPLKWIKWLLKANEILASWQYMEVFLISVMVGGIQIPILCDLLVGSTCDPIQPLLNFLVRKGIMSHATCFSAMVIVEAGLWLLFFASIVLYICSVVVREKAGSVVALYDPFWAAQYDRGLAHGQFLYYKNRADALRTIGLLEYCGELEGRGAGGKSYSPSSKDDTPVAGVVV